MQVTLRRSIFIVCFVSRYFSTRNKRCKMIDPKGEILCLFLASLLPKGDYPRIAQTKGLMWPQRQNTRRQTFITLGSWEKRTDGHAQPLSNVIEMLTSKKNSCSFPHSRTKRVVYCLLIPHRTTLAICFTISIHRAHPYEIPCILYIS